MRAGRHVYVFPASYSQQRLWFLDRLAPGLASYNVPAAIHIETTIDRQALRRAIDALVRRHESLRTSFLEVDGQPVQVVRMRPSAPIRFVDLTDHPSSNRLEEAERLVRLDAAQPFDLARAPLLRALLVSWAPDRHILLVTCHHSIADGASVEVLFRDLSELYAASVGGRRSRLRPLLVQFADYAAWQRGADAAQTHERQLEYWRRELSHLPDRLALPTDKPHRPEQRFRGAAVPIQLCQSTAALRALARSADATTFMVIAAGLQVLLHRYTGAIDVPIGSPVTGRHHEYLDNVIGFFVNTVVIRARLDDDPTVLELLRQVRRTVLNAFAHQDVPFERVVAELAPRRDLSHQPLFQVLFGLQTVDAQPADAREVTRVPIETGTSKVDLTLSLTDNGTTIEGHLEYDTDLYERVTIERMRDALVTLLSGMAADPAARASKIPLLADCVRNEIVYAWNPTERPFPRDESLDELVYRQATASPDAVAVRDPRLVLTYGELWRRSATLAARLKASGVQPGDRVGACLERSTHMVIAWLAVLRVGAAYVPLDPEYPPARLATLVTDADIRLTLVHGKSGNAIPAGFSTIDVDIDSAIDERGRLPAACEFDGKSRGNAPAYVVYTSGSTGTPKGAVIPHRAVTRLVINTDYAAIDRSDRIAQASNASFDAATFEIWGALANGASVVIVPRDVLLDPSGFATFLCVEGITVLFLTTALFNQIVAERPDAFASLRCLLVGGEMADPGRFREVLQHGAPGTLLHVYGPTETTTFATYFPVTEVPPDATSLPIGRPIANTRAYIVDRHLELVPAGVEGELVIAGDGVALEYLARPELSAEKFIDERWRSGGTRAYRTGDRVRWRADGVLEIVGRLDDQVKIRGFRVEPAEVEATLAAHPAVRHATVVPRADNGDRRLAAYVVPHAPVTADELRAFLRERLPDYMIPALVTMLDRLPLTANGKVDRAALPVPDLRPMREHAVAPRSEVEATLVAIWVDVLRIDTVGIHDNFFQLGGDSIRAIQVVSRAARAGLGITPRLLFRHQSIAELAGVLTARRNDTRQELVVGSLPLTPIQRWFLDCPPTEPSHFNQAVMIDVPATVSLEVADRVARELLRHHDALRLRFALIDGRWRQLIAPPDANGVVVEYDVSSRDAAETGEIARLATAVQASLDLANGPLMRMALFRTGHSEPSRLLIVVHHLAVDLVSWSILLEDLQTALAQSSRNEAVVLPPKTASFKEWAERIVAARPDPGHTSGSWSPDEWRGACALPADFDFRPSDNIVANCSTATASLDEELTAAVAGGAAARLDAQIQHLVIAALVRTIGDWTGGTAIALDVEGHGRDALGDEIDVSRTVGWFTTISHRLFQTSSRKNDLRSLVEHVKERLESGCDAPDDGEAPVAFNYMGRVERGADPAAADRSMLIGATRSPKGRRRHLIEIDAGIAAGRFVAHWTYSTAIHRHETIARLATELCQRLRRFAGLDDSPHTSRAQVPAHDSGEFGLSPLQEGMLFHTLHDPRGGYYVMLVAVPLAGDLDVSRFRAAWDLVVERNPMLRTAFVWKGVDRPRQTVADAVTLSWDLQDWRELGQDRQEAHLREYLEAERVSGFDPARAPLMRFALVRTSEHEWRFIWVCHHLLLDGWSRPLVLRDAADAYAALGRTEVLAAPARRPYRDYIAWLAGRDQNAARRFWTARLAGFHEPTPIVAALPAIEVSGGEPPFALRTRLISQTATLRLNATLRRHQLTLSTVMHGAWAVLLGAYTRRDDVVFGTTVSGRPAELEGVEEMIGPFINTIPSRVHIERETRANQWFSSLQEQSLGAREFEYAPLVQTAACSKVPAGTPLFESLLVVENYPDAAGVGATDDRAISTEWTSYPLTLSTIPGTSLRLELAFAARIDPAAAAGMLDQLACFLEAFADDPKRAVGNLPLMTDRERQRTLVDWNRTEKPLPSTSLRRLVVEHADRNPDAEAVVCGARRTGYGELVRLGHQLAERLHSAGVRRGDRLGLFLDRCSELPLAMLAADELGAVWVPLDTTAPEERLQLVIADAGLAIVVTRGALAEALTGLPVVAILADSEQQGPVAVESSRHDAGESLHADEPAYVVFTSGTTGGPKGVIISRRSLLNHAYATTERHGLGPTDRVLQFASPAFDVAIEEIVPTLAVGAAVVMWPVELTPSLTELMSLVAEERLTVLNLPTPFWHEWVDAIDGGSCSVPSSVRQVIVGTDRAAPEKLSRWRARVPPHVGWCNAYGCTEATITSTTYEPPHAANGQPLCRGTVPIGQPIANTRIYVVDDRLEPVPIDVPGELVIAGDGVALGYLNRVEQAATHFVEERWRPHGGRAYRTGDLARWRADGVLELLGRLDEQVKIRGHRVEPAEVESSLARHAAVRHAVVVAPLHQDERRLVAYVVTDQPTVVETLSGFLRTRLPSYMVPSTFVHLERLPVTSNGKVDRTALPPPVFGAVPGRHLPPETRTEQAIAGIWADVLGVEAPGLDDDFFRLGGHSLTAIRVVSRIQRTLGLDLPLRAVFDHPTIAGLAACLDRLAETPVDSTIPVRRGRGPCRLSFAQERLWFLAQLSPGTGLYNLPCAMHITGSIDLAAIGASLNDIVQRHEALRATFEIVGGVPVQVIAPSLRIPLTVIDLTGVAETHRGREAVRGATVETQRPFDLEHGPLLRAAVLRLDAAQHVLVVTTHHIVSDGWSVGVLLKELQTCYEARSQGRLPALPALPIQYRDYAVWQRERLQGELLHEQLTYWRTQLADAPAALELPTDRPRPPQRRFRGAYEMLTLPPELTAAIHALGGSERATLFVVLLAAWQLQLSRWSGQDDLVVGCPVAGRHRPETEPLIGFFLNNLVMRTRLRGDPTFRELLRRVREIALGAFAHQDVPFELLLADLAPARDASRTPLFQVFLNVLTFDEERLHLPTAIAESFSLAGGATSHSSPEFGEDPQPLDPESEPHVWSQFDLTLYAGERDGSVRFVLVYDTDLFTSATMVQMLDQLASVLAQAAAHPDQPISHFELATAAARRVLPDAAAHLDDTWRGSVAQRFELQAREHPERIAIESADEIVTYRELDERSSQLAHTLRVAGVRQGDVVALYAARSTSLVWGLLGITKSGAAFMVLDPQYPANRLQAHVEIARPRALVCIDAAGSMAAALESQMHAAGVHRVDLPSFSAARGRSVFADVPGSCPVLKVDADDVACVGFTSGSTGGPKGVVGRHGPLTHFVPWLAETFGLGPDDRFSMLSGLSHDPMQREVFTPLCLGGTIVIPSADDYSDASRLARWIEVSRTTVAHLTPALGQLIVQGANAAAPPVRTSQLRVAFFVGDVLRTDDVIRLSEVAPRMRCVNYYGATETQRAVGYYLVPAGLARAEVASPIGPADNAIPIGRGIADVQLLVLNGAGRLCGIGELGEIHIRSPHLARGYLRDSVLTAERLLVNPFTGLTGDRLYKTGDLGRYRPDGQVIFAGRKDSQVKIRGFRVELSEIEAVIAQHPAVRDVKVVAREDPGIERRLVAYVVCIEGSALNAGDVRAALLERLPAYMAPAHVVMLPKLPVTPNAKLDWAALPPPAEGAVDGLTATRSPIEDEVAAIWRSLPGVVDGHLHAGFFESGGHSLLSTVLLSRIRDRFGVAISVAQFFAAPTIAGLAAAVTSAGAAGSSKLPPLRRIPRVVHRVPLGPSGQLAQLPAIVREQLTLAITGVRSQ